MLHLSGTPSSSHGFSVVDLITVMAIVGIIASVAFPMYQSYALRIHRTEARVALMDVAERMQKYYFENKTYTDDLLALGLNSSPYVTASGRYSMRVEDNGGGGGVIIEGNATAGNTVINFDAATIDLLATQGGKGKGLRVLSWRTLP